MDQLRILTRSEYVGLTRDEVYARETERLRREMAALPPSVLRLKAGRPLSDPEDAVLAEHRRRNRTAYLRKRAAGICAQCPSRALPGLVLCEPCRRKRIAYAKRLPWQRNY